MSQIVRQSADVLEAVQAAIDGLCGDDGQRIARSGLAVLDTLLRKNHDYGGSVFSPPGWPRRCRSKRPCSAG